MGATYRGAFSCSKNPCVDTLQLAAALRTLLPDKLTPTQMFHPLANVAGQPLNKCGWSHLYHDHLTSPHTCLSLSLRTSMGMQVPSLTATGARKLSWLPGFRFAFSKGLQASKIAQGSNARWLLFKRLSFLSDICPPTVQYHSPLRLD